MHQVERGHRCLVMPWWAGATLASRNDPMATTCSCDTNICGPFPLVPPYDLRADHSHVKQYSRPGSLILLLDVLVRLIFKALQQRIDLLLDLLKPLLDGFRHGPNSVAYFDTFPPAFLHHIKSFI